MFKLQGKDKAASVRLSEKKTTKYFNELDNIKDMAKFSRNVGNFSEEMKLRKMNESIGNKACRYVRGFVEREKWWIMQGFFLKSGLSTNLKVAYKL